MKKLNNNPLPVHECCRFIKEAWEQDMITLQALQTQHKENTIVMTWIGVNTTENQFHSSKTCIFCKSLLKEY